MKTLYKGYPTEFGQPVGGSEVFMVLTGDSTEVANLPTEDVFDGSIFIESDTHTALMFNAKTGEWM